VVWKVKRNVPTRASVLLHEDLIYMVDDGGIASCVEAKSGDEVWKKRVGGNYSAAPLYADGRIYFFSEEGKTTVVAPGREMKVLGESQLDAGFMASPAVADNALILRTKTHLYRVEQGKGK
jgi:outer membrane protein assembly factor BamB